MKLEELALPRVHQFRVATREVRQALEPTVRRLVAEEQLSYGQVGAQVGLNQNQVYRLCKEFGIKPSPLCRPTAEHIEPEPDAVRPERMTEHLYTTMRPRCVELIAEGYSQRQIGERLVLNAYQVGRIFKRYGLATQHVRRGEPAKAARKPRARRTWVAHCRVCDGPVAFTGAVKTATARAEEHQRLTSMRIRGVYLAGRCEGSLDVVVWRLVPKAVPGAA